MGGLRGFFCEIYQHIIERVINVDQLWNMYDTVYIQKQNYILRGSRNLSSNSSEVNFHMTFVICASAAETVVPSLLIVPGKLFNRGVL